MHVHHHADQAAQAHLQVFVQQLLGRGNDERRGVLNVAADELCHDGVASGEVLVKGADADARALGDGVGREAFEPMAHEQHTRGVDDGIHGVDGALLRGQTGSWTFLSFSRPPRHLVRHASECERVLMFDQGVRTKHLLY
jgi:hypothetical protein